MKKCARLSLLMPLFAFAAGALVSCAAGGAGLPAIPPTKIPDSLAATSLVPKTVGMARGARDLQTVFYDEYSDFYCVPQVALNYNGLADELLNELKNSSETSWSRIPGGSPFTKQFQGRTMGGGVYRANDDFTDWEWVSPREPGGIFLRVTKKSGYVHSRWFYYLVNGGSDDSIDIIETPAVIVTKVVRIRNIDGGLGFTSNSTAQGYPVYYDEFAAVSFKDDAQRSLGEKRYEEASITTGTVLATADYSPLTPNDGFMVGAFDTSQLMIRPPSLVAPLGCNFPATAWAEFVTYPSSEGETFDPGLYPALAPVMAALDVGITPAVLAKARVNSDGTENDQFPEWGPADIGL